MSLGVEDASFATCVLGLDISILSGDSQQLPVLELLRPGGEGEGGGCKTQYLGPMCPGLLFIFQFSWIDGLRYDPYLCTRKAICHRSFPTQWERDEHSKECFWYCPRQGCPRKPLTKRRDIDQHKSYHRREDAKAQRVTEALEEDEI